GAPKDVVIRAGNAAPVLQLAASAPTATGLVVLTGTLTDASADPADLAVEVVGVTAVATIVGRTTGLTTSANGTSFNLAWNTIADLGATNRAVTLRITPRDRFAP